MPNIFGRFEEVSLLGCSRNYRRRAERDTARNVWGRLVERFIADQEVIAERLARVGVLMERAES